MLFDTPTFRSANCPQILGKRRFAESSQSFFEERIINEIDSLKKGVVNQCVDHKVATAM